MKVRSHSSALLYLALSIALVRASAAFGEQHPPGMHHGFRDAEHWAQVFESPERNQWQKPDEVVKALNLRPGQTVADIGAGTGYFTRRFAAAVGPTGRALGLDIEPAMVEYMKKDAEKLGLGNYQARLVQPDNPGLAPHSVDLVFLCDAYHHLDDRPAYFRRLAGVLKPGGRVVIVDFHKRKLPVGPPPQHKVSREQVIEEFGTAGYRLVRSPDFLPYQYFLEFEPIGPGSRLSTPKRLAGCGKSPPRPDWFTDGPSTLHENHVLSQWRRIGPPSSIFPPDQGEISMPW